MDKGYEGKYKEERKIGMEQWWRDDGRREGVEADWHDTVVANYDDN